MTGNSRYVATGHETSCPPLSLAQGRKPEELQAAMVAEEIAAWAGYRDGWIGEMYFQSEPITVISIIKADSVSDVEEYLKSLSMVQAELFDQQIFTLGP